MSSTMYPFMVSNRSIDLAATGLVRRCRIWIVLAVNIHVTVRSGKPPMDELAGRSTSRWRRPPRTKRPSNRLDSMVDLFDGRSRCFLDTATFRWSG